MRRSKSLCEGPVLSPLTLASMNTYDFPGPGFGSIPSSVRSRTHTVTVRNDSWSASQTSVCEAAVSAGSFRARLRDLTQCRGWVAPRCWLVQRLLHAPPLGPGGGPLMGPGGASLTPAGAARAGRDRPTTRPPRPPCAACSSVRLPWQIGRCACGPVPCAARPSPCSSRGGSTACSSTS